jgi:DNA mismatch repair protein MutS2
VRAALSRTTEGTAVLRTLGRQPYHDLPDIAPALQEAGVSGTFLEPLALSDVASFIEGAIEIGRRVARAEGAPGLAQLASGVSDESEIASAVRRAILPGGEVADNASPRLAEIRRTLARLKSQLQSVMESYLQGKDADRLLQDKLITTRNDRYVLLLKAEHRGSVPGIIHGSSGSGASLFVEPMPAVEVNNDIVSMTEEEREEVIRILRGLTSRVRDRGRHLSRSVEILGELDFTQAMALVARDMDAIPPEIVSDTRPGLRLLQARHPLLMTSVVERVGIARRSTREPVPVTIEIKDGASILVISGPEHGREDGRAEDGRTDGPHGAVRPAHPGRSRSSLPVFRRVFADIGDEQSIAANLSTFSAHLANIVSMTKDLGHCRRWSCSTRWARDGPDGRRRARGRHRGHVPRARGHGHRHHASRADEGVRAVHARGGARIVRVRPQDVRADLPAGAGDGGTIARPEMAERLGLPAETVRDARSRLDLKEAQAEALLKKLEADQATLRARKRTCARRRIDVESAEARVGLAEREITARKKTEIETFARELRRRGEEAVRKASLSIEDTIRKLEEERKSSAAAVAKAKSSVARLVRQAQDEVIAESGGTVEREEETSAPVAMGMRVKVRSLGVTGQVMALHGDEAELAISGKRCGCRRESSSPSVGQRARAAPPAAPVPRRASPKSKQRAARRSTWWALRSTRPSEAGQGSGQRRHCRTFPAARHPRLRPGNLRRAVAEFLEGHPHVAKVNVASEGRGGVTVVELRE